MYGDLLLDRLGVKFVRPAPLHLELLHMLSNFHWNALGSTLGWWFCLLGRRLGRRKRIFGNPFPFGNVPCKIQLVPKTVSHTPYTTGTLLCPREKHGCDVKFHFRESEQNVLGERPGTTASTGPLCRTDITHKRALTEDFQRSGGCNGSEQRGCICVVTTRRAQSVSCTENVRQCAGVSVGMKKGCEK